MPSLPPDDLKLQELILFLAQRSEGDAPFGATKLNKLLFYSDFLAYRNLGKAITWHEYQKLANGPAPRKLLPVVRQLEAGGRAVTVARDYFGKTLKRLIALDNPDVRLFDGPEIALVTELVSHFWGKDASAMSDLSHRFIGWKAAAIGETIPYELALVRRGARSDAAERHALELASLARERLAGSHGQE